MHTTPKVERRALLTGAAIAAVASAVRAQTQPQPPPAAPAATRLDDAPLAPATTVTVERRGEIVLIGLNRPATTTRRPGRSTSKAPSRATRWPCTS